MTTQLAGLLRTELRVSRLPTHPCFTLRSLSTTSVLRAHSLRPHLRPHAKPSPILTLVSARSFSLLPKFLRRNTATPSPEVITKINILEADANANPHDVAKQVALFAALSATNTKSGYEVIINRWERMCEHVSIPISHRNAHTNIS